MPFSPDPRLLGELLDSVPDEQGHWVVGALVSDGRGHIYAHRRTLDRKLFAGCWDVAGGHVEAGESLRQALERELVEETGWHLDEVLGCAKEFEWEADGERRHEVDFVVTVHGSLAAPVLEEGKQDLFGWFDAGNAEVLLENRSPGDTAVHDMICAGLALLEGRRTPS